jgi:hypothetical protein
MGCVDAVSGITVLVVVEATDDVTNFFVDKWRTYHIIAVALSRAQGY